MQIVLFKHTPKSRMKAENKIKCIFIGLQFESHPCLKLVYKYIKMD